MLPRSKPTRPCAVSCGAIPARAIRSFSPSWRRPRALRRPPARSWRALTASERTRAPTTTGAIRDDPDAKITKMKDGRTHLAHKAEHAVDLQTGAVVAVTVQDADDAETTTRNQTLTEAAEQIEAVLPDGDGLKEVVGDKGYHSSESLVDLEAVGVRSYI